VAQLYGWRGGWFAEQAWSWSNNLICSLTLRLSRPWARLSRLELSKEWARLSRPWSGGSAGMSRIEPKLGRPYFCWVKVPIRLWYIHETLNFPSSIIGYWFFYLRYHNEGWKYKHFPHSMDSSILWKIARSVVL
jgi:hypothetical protein